MKTIIESAGIDGLNVKFESSFYFDTWEEVFAFIRAVEKASIGKVENP